MRRSKQIVNTILTRFSPCKQTPLNYDPGAQHGRREGRGQGGHQGGSNFSFFRNLIQNLWQKLCMTIIKKSLKYFRYALISSPSDIVCKFGILALKMSKSKGGSNRTITTRSSWNYKNLSHTHLKRYFIAWFSQILILSPSDIIVKYYNLTKKVVHAKKIAKNQHRHQSIQNRIFFLLRYLL